MMIVRTSEQWRARLLGGLVLFVWGVFGLVCGSAAAEHRLALVIGNARYPEVPLNNPENDARLIASTLRRLGFEVTERENLGTMEFQRVLRDYVRRLQDEDGAAVFYYAGHAVQIGGRNYLLPVDINLRDEEEVRDDAIEIGEQFIKRIEHAKTRVRIVILDACRDDPYVSSRARSGSARGVGLAEMSASGDLIAFSSAPGQAAEDGPPGSGSVYTRSLSKEMLAEDVQVEKMFKNVLVDVLRDTHDQQIPWINSSLTVDFSFHPTSRAATATATASAHDEARPAKVETALAGVPVPTAARSDATPHPEVAWDSSTPVVRSSPVPASRGDRMLSTASGQAEALPAFDEAVKAVVAQLIERAGPDLTAAASQGARSAPLVVDPLIDASTGFRTRATQAVERELLSALHARLPRLETADLSPENLARRPLILIGTVTPLDREGGTFGARTAYAIRLALLDLQRGIVSSSAAARSRLEGADATPTRFYGEMPAWAPDPWTEAYARASNGATAGAPIDPAYRDGLAVSALVSPAIGAYEAGRPREALEAFAKARRQAVQPQLRIESGLYLAATRLDRVGDAQQAFARIVDLGLARGRLGVRFQFRPGATQFLDDAPASSGYGLWLGLVAQRAEIRRGCLQVAGHTSRKGDELASARLSLLRAQTVKERIDAIDPQIASRTVAVGRGFQESLSGLGTDDGRDAIDQRVEFRVLDCHRS
ncbi:MAG: caspase family protein [Burkholderiaceae bacterium]|nr:caspase family protein [Burkholderiaceae bacterium]